MRSTAADRKKGQRRARDIRQPVNPVDRFQETLRGGTLGLCSWLFLRKGLLAGRVSGKHVLLLLLCCVGTGILASLGQTFALYVDSKMMGYYTHAMVFGVMIWRVLVYILLSAIFGSLSLPIISALKKTKFV